MLCAISYWLLRPPHHDLAHRPVSLIRPVARSGVEDFKSLVVADRLSILLEFLGLLVVSDLWFLFHSGVIVAFRFSDRSAFASFSPHLRRSRSANPCPVRVNFLEDFAWRRFPLDRKTPNKTLDSNRYERPSPARLVSRFRSYRCVSYAFSLNIECA